MWLKKDVGWPRVNLVYCSFNPGGAKVYSKAASLNSAPQDRCRTPSSRRTLCAISRTVYCLMVGVVCPVAPVAFKGVALARVNHRRRATLRRTRTVADALTPTVVAWHGQFLRLNIAIIPRVHSQGHGHWKTREWERRASVARCA